MLPQPLSDVAADDLDGGRPGVSRHFQRLQEISLQNMIEGPARDLINSALRTRTMPAGEALGPQVGDAVDFRRPPASKGFSGWKVPATVTDISTIEQGQVQVQWQGRSMSARLPDLSWRWYTQWHPLALAWQIIYGSFGSSFPCCTSRPSYQGMCIHRRLFGFFPGAPGGPAIGR